MPAGIPELFTVLLIEDNRDDERLSLRALNSCGLPLDVRVAEDGEQALLALGLTGSVGNDEQSTPDLVISDLKMPKMNGDEVLTRARRDDRFRDVPYVLFSSSNEDIDVKRCMELGASDYCVKPVDYNQYREGLGAIARRWLTECGGDRESSCLCSDR